MSPPFLTTQISSGDTVAIGNPAQVPLLVVCSPIATTNACFAFSPGDDPRATLGLGMGCDELLYLLRATAGIVAVAVAAATWTAAPSITHLDAAGGVSPTGPTVTVALGAGQPGCLDDHNLVLRITTGGALGTATASLAYDGGAGAETFNLPTEGPGVLRGTVDLTPGADLEGLTLVFTAPGSVTKTFAAGSLAGAAAGLKAATATSASPVTLTASDLLTAGKTAILAHPRRLTFATAGSTAADAPANVVITGTRLGAAVTETLVLAQTAASVTSLYAYDTITSLAYATGDGTGATIAIGYSSAFANAAEVAAALNVLFLASTALAATARIAQVGVAQYLEIVSTGTGTGTSLTIDATSTADTPALGFTSGASNLTTTGTAATYALPTSGLVLTFPTGTYVYLESYLAACTGPRASSSAISAAVAAAIAGFATIPFGFVVVGQPADSPSNCKALVDTLETIRAAALVATIPRCFYCIVGSPWHTASATAATNATNITTADGLLLAAFASAAANPNSVAHDDVYVPGSALLAPGGFRRSAVIAMACKRASSNRVAATCAEGTVPGATLTAGDGLTLARDQNTAVTHLEGLDGPGFFCLKSADDGGNVKFAIGATRAGKTSRLRHDGDFAVCAETAREVQAVVKPWEGQRPGLDPLSGQMADHEKQGRAGQVDGAIRPFLLPESGADAGASAPLPNCTDFGVLVADPPTGKFQDSGITPVKVTITVLGTITQVVIGIAASGVTTIAAPAGG